MMWADALATILGEAVPERLERLGNDDRVKDVHEDDILSLSAILHRTRCVGYYPCHLIGRDFS